MEEGGERTFDWEGWQCQRRVQQKAWYESGKRDKMQEYMRIGLTVRGSTEKEGGRENLRIHSRVGVGREREKGGLGREICAHWLNSVISFKL